MDISELKRTDLSIHPTRHPWEISRTKIIHFLLKKQSPHYKAIIDFGSGDVFVLSNLERQGMADRYLAIDNAYNENIVSAISSLSNQSSISFHNEIEEINKKDLPADCFLFLDVIEHCPDDKLILQTASLHGIAGKNATVFVTVPAFQSLFSQHDHLLNHYRRYNTTQLTTVCREAGLTVVTTGYFFFSLLPLRLFQLFLERTSFKKKEKSIDNWQGSKTITKMISALLWFDFKFGYFLNRIAIKLPGLSCYCICHNSPS